MALYLHSPTCLHGLVLSYLTLGSVVKEAAIYTGVNDEEGHFRLKE
jgi:hypothetical protein